LDALALMLDAAEPAEAVMLLATAEALADADADADAPAPVAVAVELDDPVALAPLAVLEQPAEAGKSDEAPTGSQTPCAYARADFWSAASHAL